MAESGVAHLRMNNIGLRGELVLDPFCGTATTMVAALKHGRNSLGVELDTACCKMAASRLLNESTSLFGHAQLQIELKPPVTLEPVPALNESGPPYKAHARQKLSRSRPPRADS